MMHLDPELALQFAGPDAFSRIMGLGGTVYRRHKNRTTSRVVIAGRPYFLKVHGPAGWREVLKDALRLRRPILTALPEVEAIRRVRELGVATPEVVGYGRRGRNPARLESFLVTRSIEPARDVKALIPEILAMAPARRRAASRQLVTAAARIARALHANGMNHRDLYTNHLLVPEDAWRAWGPGRRLEPILIDLHRVQLRRRTPRRWIAKDLAGLLFSSYDARLGVRDHLRFWRAYWGRDWKQRVRSTAALRRLIERRARRLYRAETGREPPPPDARASSG